MYENLNLDLYKVASRCYLHLLRHGYRSILLTVFFLIIYTRDNIYVKILPKPQELSIWPLYGDVGKNRFHYSMYIITKYIAVFKLESMVG